jgi:hypothetical protein
MKARDYSNLDHVVVVPNFKMRLQHLTKTRKSGDEPFQHHLIVFFERNLDEYRVAKAYRRLDRSAFGRKRRRRF